MRTTRAFDTPEGRVTYELDVRPAPGGVMTYHFVGDGQLAPADGGETISLDDAALRRLRDRHEG